MPKYNFALAVFAGFACPLHNGGIALSFNIPKTFVAVNRQNNGLSQLKLGTGVSAEGSAESLSNDPCNVAPEVPFAKKLAFLSQAVYNVDNSLEAKADLESAKKQIAEDGRFDNVIVHSFFDTKVDTQGMVVSDPVDKYVAVVFRGTQGPRDILTDASAVKTTFGPLEQEDDDDEDGGLDLDDIPRGARVHRGFCLSFFSDDLHDQIINTVEEVLKENPDYRVTITGHSLGGALSTLCGAYTAKKFPDKLVSVINFGSPKVGNRKFKEWVDSIPNLPIWRYVYEEDIVPRGFIFDYHHPGHLIQLNGMNGKSSRVHYLHDGDKELGLAGAPRGEWDLIPNAFDTVQDHFGYWECKDDSMWDIGGFERVAKKKKW
eukprot:CAMPEP_0195512736 /NCGR_PEP_ID=MMETSP0794_2-20130614/4598_1 /TAXON_ID=515487 /ORGANISM="Stephanopyxis turris, Strain CCMP 815" /LENGTH=373 /DNA_ID=CAMNT_0040640593 /DNA_START=63 /DNA_END=1181 /DNA_ORIENTATION=-